MKIKQLEYLVKVMECGSITQAAQQIGVSQPGLTKAISNLEEEYGIQIFNRKSRGVEFTQQGLDFVLYAKGVIAAVESYPRAISKHLRKARLFVAAQQLDFINPLMMEIYNKHSKENIFFNLVETDRNSVVEDVLRGKVDFGIAVRTSMDIRDLIWNLEEHRLDIRVIDTSKVYVALSSKHYIADKEKLCMDDIASFTHIALDMEEQAKQSFWFDRGQYNNFNNNRIIYVNTASACENFLLHSNAISFVSKWTRGCFHSPEIKTLPLDNSAGIQELVMITRKGEGLSGAEAEFAATLYRRLGKKVPDEILVNEKFYQTEAWADKLL